MRLASSSQTLSKGDKSGEQAGQSRVGILLEFKKALVEKLMDRGIILHKSELKVVITFEKWNNRVLEHFLIFVRIHFGADELKRKSAIVVEGPHVITGIPPKLRREKTDYRLVTVQNGGDLAEAQSCCMQSVNFGLLGGRKSSEMRHFSKKKC